MERGKPGTRGRDGEGLIAPNPFPVRPEPLPSAPPGGRLTRSASRLRAGPRACGRASARATGLGGAQVEEPGLHGPGRVTSLDTSGPHDLHETSKPGALGPSLRQTRSENLRGARRLRARARARPPHATPRTAARAHARMSGRSPEPRGTPRSGLRARELAARIGVGGGVPW